MLQFNHVSKAFKKGWTILEDITFQMDPGDFVFVVGPTGAGKSTLLRLISMEEFPTSGEVVVLGHSSKSIERRDIPRLRRHLGIVFQDLKLLSDRNVFDNVAFSLKVIGATSKEIRKRTMITLRLVGLSHRRSASLGELSGGERQRVAIARALVNHPHLLLADEPTGSLDHAVSAEILKLLRHINARGTAVLMTTHDLATVKNLPYRVISIDGGRIVSEEM